MDEIKFKPVHHDVNDKKTLIKKLMLFQDRGYGSISFIELKVGWLALWRLY